MSPPTSINDLGSNFAKRFGPLLDEIAKSTPKDERRKEPALVPAAGKGSSLNCTSYFAGKDVEIVLVRANLDSGGKPLAVKETLTYRQDVAGSDLVYDLTGEFMQGKARPFDCDLREQPARLYALLPFQVEELVVSAKQVAAKITVDVEFRNGLSQRVAGSLPCHVELRMPGGKVAWDRYLATSSDGALKAAAELPPQVPPGKWSLVVRSLLDGKLVTLPVEVEPVAGK
jgi:hypothetical protein